jgi:DegV family protein with EDD domain
MNGSRTKVGICTDSSAQLPSDLVERYDIEVVPITVTVDEHDYLEGVDLDADTFYRMLAADVRPTVSTSQPSPGQFAVAYDDLIGRGCTEILSVHISAGISGTLNSARLAAHRLEVPVRLVDSGTASFGVGCCVWAAADALLAGASLDEAAAVAERLAPSIGNVFVVGALDLIRGGGRGTGIEDGDGVPVLTLRNGTVEVIRRVDTLVDAVNAMAAYTLSWVGGHQAAAASTGGVPAAVTLNVAIGTADAAAAPLSQALQDAVEASSNIHEVVHYRIGPSVGAHTGPGTAGCFMFPAPTAPAPPSPTPS